MDKKNKTFSIRERLNSFRYAFSGLARLVCKEHNFRIHLVATTLVVIAGVLLNISPAEWLVIVLTIGMVLVAESFNSAVEHLCDIVSPEEDQRIRNIKDILAAAVLISAFVAVIIGLVIFIPHIMALFL
ncbi:MAG TPA: diacylglycerol kinase [Bacteroidales bacterium]|nr:diacylglycerol kinase [Bacteroidales bacterium]